MKRMVRYTVAADRVAENERLIERVFAELHEAAPPGLRYASFRLGDGVSFVHIVDDAGGVLPTLPAFKAFTAGIRDRCVEPPVSVGLKEVGSYGLADG